MTGRLASSTGLTPAARRRALLAAGPTRILGIVNVTPDSFSDGGRWLDPASAIAQGQALATAGADIIDVGGESTRPGATRVTAATELERVLPVVTALAQSGLAVSIDTIRAEVAGAAIAAGAVFVNDVSGGLADPNMVATVAASQAGYIVGHWRGWLDDQAADRATYDDVVATVQAELAQRLEAAQAGGIPHSRLVIDPGLGFSKSADHNWALLRAARQIHNWGYPVLWGASRKRFLATTDPTAGQTEQLDAATAAVTAYLAGRGAWAVRTHTVTAHRQAITVANRLASVPPEVVTGATLTSDRIDLIGLTAHGRHGVFASEKVTPQLFRVDLRAWLEPVTERRDQLAATVDYGQLAAVVTDQIEHQSFDLIETLADQIAQATLAADGLRAVEVTVHKPQAPIEQPFDDVAVTAHRTRPPTPSPRTTARSTSHSAEPVTVPSPRTAARSRRAVFSLGSNVGDRSGWLQFGVTGLVTTPGVSFQAISSLWETTPIGVTGQPDYLNLILIAETTLPAEELLERGLTLESLAGRVRPSTSSHQPQHGPRPLDIDLIAVGAETVTSDRLQLPHPRAHKRAFVLAPWLEADPAARLNGQPLTDWLAASSDQVVRRLPDSHLTVPASAGLS